MRGDVIRFTYGPQAGPCGLRRVDKRCAGATGRVDLASNRYRMPPPAGRRPGGVRQAGAAT
jgi:hypothetical protein